MMICLLGIVYEVILINYWSPEYELYHMVCLPLIVMSRMIYLNKDYKAAPWLMD